MSITPQSINLAALPSLPLAERRALPNCAAIYFALAPNAPVLYIGQAQCLAKRWMSTSHHRYGQLQAIGNTRIAWLTVSDDALLNSIEAACIDYFQPVLNGRAERPTVRIVVKAFKARLDYQQRIGRSVTIAEVARGTELSRAAISAIERGTKQPSLDTVALLCKFYGVPVEALLEYEDLIALQAATAAN